MDLRGKIILVKRLPNSVKPNVINFDVYTNSKSRFHGAKYYPATDEEIASILEANEIDPSSYTNPLAAKPVEKKKKKVKEEQIKEVEQIDVQQEEKEEE